MLVLVLVLVLVLAIVLALACALQGPPGLAEWATMASEHGQLEVDRIAIEYIAWTGALLDNSLERRLTAAVHDHGRLLLERIVSMPCEG